MKTILGPGPYEGFTATTITTLKQLARECSRMKAAGYSVDEEQYVDGARCLAATVRDRDGVVVASVGISSPIGRFPRERDATAARQVCEAAAEISAVLSAEAVD